MVGMAAGLGVGGIKTILSITARTNAVGRFAALSKGILGSNNALSRFARSAVITTGVMSGLGFVVKTLMNPVTGIIALAGIGLAVIRWQRYQTAVTNTRLQLSLMGQSAGETTRRVKALNAAVGTGMATAILRAGSEVMQLSAAAQAEVAVLARDMEIAGIDNAAENLDLLSKALRTGTIPDLEAALAVWGLTTKEYDSANKLLIHLRENTKKAGVGFGVVALQAEEARLSDFATNIMGPINEVVAGLGAWLIETLVDAIWAIPNMLIRMFKGENLIFTIVDEILRVIFPNQLNIENAARQMWSTFAKALDELSSTFFQGVWDFIMSGFSGDASVIFAPFIESVKKWGREIWNNEWFQVIIGRPLTVIIEGFKAMWNSDLAVIIKDWISDRGDDLWEFFTVTIPGFAAGLSHKIRTIFYQYVSLPIINMLNSIIDKVNEFIPDKWKLGNIGSPDAPVFKEFEFGYDHPGASKYYRQEQSRRTGRSAYTFGAPDWGMGGSPDDPSIKVDVHIGTEKIESIVNIAAGNLYRQAGMGVVQGTLN